MGLQSESANRAQTLSKMRSKLATAQGQEDIMVNPDPASWRKKLPGLAGTASAIAIVLGLAFLVCWATLADKTQPSLVTSKKMQSLLPPAPSLTPDQQALYWVYALYDWEKLVKTYGVSPRALIETSRAKSELERLLPMASGQVQWAVLKYRNQDRRKP